MSERAVSVGRVLRAARFSTVSENLDCSFAHGPSPRMEAIRLIFAGVGAQQYMVTMVT